MGNATRVSARRFDEGDVHPDRPETIAGSAWRGALERLHVKEGKREVGAEGWQQRSADGAELSVHLGRLGIGISPIGPRRYTQSVCHRLYLASMATMPRAPPTISAPASLRTNTWVPLRESGAKDCNHRLAHTSLHRPQGLVPPGVTKTDGRGGKEGGWRGTDGRDA